MALCGPQVFAKPHDLPVKGSLIGEPSVYIVQSGDYFQLIGETYNVGFLSLITANPGVDPLLPDPNTPLILPTQMILPHAEPVGIVVNLPELRLYYFDPNLPIVHVYPIGIGQMGNRTPVIRSFISQKREQPDWVVPKSIRKRYFSEKNIQLPAVVPAGPNNPLGNFALRLGHSEYLIHGTNQRFGIGLSVSSGCIRMFEQDIEELFNRVAINTPVRIIDLPVKYTRTPDNNVYLEVHSALEGSKQQLDLRQTLINLRQFVAPLNVDESQIQRIFEASSGIPVLLKLQDK